MARTLARENEPFANPRRGPVSAAKIPAYALRAVFDPALLFVQVWAGVFDLAFENEAHAGFGGAAHVGGPLEGGIAHEGEEDGDEGGEFFFLGDENLLVFSLFLGGVDCLLTNSLRGGCICRVKVQNGLGMQAQLGGGNRWVS